MRVYNAMQQVVSARSHRCRRSRGSHSGNRAEYGATTSRRAVLPTAEPDGNIFTDVSACSSRRRKKVRRYCRSAISSSTSRNRRSTRASRSIRSMWSSPPRPARPRTWERAGAREQCWRRKACSSYSKRRLPRVWSIRVGLGGWCCSQTSTCVPIAVAAEQWQSVTPKRRVDVAPCPTRRRITSHSLIGDSGATTRAPPSNRRRCLTQSCPGFWRSQRPGRHRRKRRAAVAVRRSESSWCLTELRIGRSIGTRRVDPERSGYAALVDCVDGLGLPCKGRRHLWSLDDPRRSCGGGGSGVARVWVYRRDAPGQACCHGRWEQRRAT